MSSLSTEFAMKDLGPLSYFLGISVSRKAFHMFLSQTSYARDIINGAGKPAEAEYRGVANVVAELCWLRNLLLEVHFPITHASMVYCDNISAIYLLENLVQHQRTKHIELDIHFVREQVKRGTICIHHVPSRHQIADIFTKGLPRVLFEDSLQSQH
ncbi:hypothetical protein E3N88_09452 [Mikania micrantha]|uniref:Reverse transcriptase Ty1/copia-type domain-containing protein n=1 Tax=Mikania micrantha TaxID=192012 RepID=A0A5N6PLA7_9ASTR|nr:hypothetical protein E3N88_09452 [Mikania micrantha]